MPTLIRPGDKIEFTLSGNARVKLSVFDTRGKHSAALLNSLLAPGVHQIPFEGDGLAKDVYVLKVGAVQSDASVSCVGTLTQP